jgi:nitroimidazol reductase NimA-like FMN-containing flavoprotein (pyridoxamine 5'-phosphate oxidase superfamily)
LASGITAALTAFGLAGGLIVANVLVPLTPMDTPPTKRATVRQKPQRAHYDRETVNAILDEGLICHVGFIVEGAPIVIPTGYARDGDRLLLHGGAASRLMGQLGEGVDVSIAVTLVDGLVLADVAFRHSMNYRSVVLFGRARAITDPAEKPRALRAFAEHIVPGRWSDLPAPTPRNSGRRRWWKCPSTRCPPRSAVVRPSREQRRRHRRCGRAPRRSRPRSEGSRRSLDRRRSRAGVPDQMAPLSRYHLSRQM